MIDKVRPAAIGILHVAAFFAFPFYPEYSSLNRRLGLRQLPIRQELALKKPARWLFGCVSELSKKDLEPGLKRKRADCAHVCDNTGRNIVHKMLHVACEFAVQRDHVVRHTSRQLDTCIRLYGGNREEG